jgi:PAS domain S-box-containing protein
MNADGLVTCWSEGARCLLGWTEKEMLGHSLDRIFPDNDKQHLAREFEDARLHGRGGGEEGWRRRRDGRRFWATGAITPLRDDHGELTGFVKVLRDRTEPRKAEEQAAEERPRDPQSRRLSLGGANRRPQARPDRH